MVLYLEDLDKDPDLLDKVWSRKLILCIKCGAEMHWSDEYCIECAYDELGDIIEQNPIPSAGIRRS